jgi:hypothetical protein
MHQSDIEMLIHCTENWRFRSAQHRYVAASPLRVRSSNIIIIIANFGRLQCVMFIETFITYVYELLKNLYACRFLSSKSHEKQCPEKERREWDPVSPPQTWKNVYLSNISMILTDLASANDTTRLPAINHKDTYLTTVKNCCHLWYAPVVSRFL